MSLPHSAPPKRSGHWPPQPSTLRFLAVVLAYLIIGTLLWWVIGLSMADEPTSNPPYGHPENQSMSVVGIR